MTIYFTLPKRSKVMVAPRSLPSSKSIRYAVRFFNLLRTLRLSITTHIHQYSSSTAQPQIALIRDRPSACIDSILHITPVSACLVIISLNLKEFYIGPELSGTGGEDALKFLALQFVAKFLELLVTASLGSIVFSWLRHYLTTESHLPLSAISSSFQISTISNLWSPEFVALCKAQYAARANRAFFASMIALTTLICLTIGPACATALKPYIADWNGGGTTFWLDALSSDLFPPAMDTSVGVHDQCGFSDTELCTAKSWNPVAESLLNYWPRSDTVLRSRPQMIETTYIPSKHSVRPLITRLVGPFYYNPGVSFATIPPASISDAVAELCTLWFVANNDAINHGFTKHQYYKDVRCTTLSLQPAVFASCIPNDTTTSSIQLSFTSPLGERLSLSASDTQNMAATYSQQSGIPANVTWISLSGHDSSRKHLGAIMTIPRVDSNGSVFLSCVVDARWVNASIDITFSRGPSIVTGDLQNRILQGLFDKTHGIERFTYIPISPDWAESITQTVTSSNSTIFEKLCDASGLCSTTAGMAAQQPAHAAAAIIAIMLSNAMAFVRSNATLQGTLKDSGTDFQWQKAMLGNNDIFTVSHHVRETYPPLTFDVKVNGYGYGLSVSSILSIVVLFAYSLLAICHVTYLITWKPVVSTSWDSVSEILALALKSEKSAALEDTGAGIWTMKTLETPVRIIALHGEVELRAGERGKHIQEDMVEPNRYYN